MEASPTKKLKRQSSAEGTPNKRAKLSRKASAESGQDDAPRKMTAAEKRMQQMRERIAARARAAE
jgi:hypothetical protein